MSQELLDGYTQRIKRYEKDIQHNYIQIAMNLYEVQEFEILKDTDYKNIYDYALNEFGFQKTKTNDLINIYKKFFFEERKAKIGILTYGDYSITQLIYMLNMSDEQLKQCNPKLSVRAVKEIRLKSSARANNTDIENTEKLENKNVIKGVFPEKNENEEKQNTLIVSEMPKASAAAPATTETRTIVTETITSQNNDFVSNDKDKITELAQKITDLKVCIMFKDKEFNQLKNDINVYKEFFNYISDSLIKSKSFISDNHIVNLNHEINSFLKNGILPEKIKFMQEVI
jgi:hypothetical protein